MASNERNCWKFNVGNTYLKKVNGFNFGSFISAGVVARQFNFIIFLKIAHDDVFRNERHKT